jgi:hypothetical protein
MQKKQLTILCHMDKICFLGNQRSPLFCSAYVSWHFIRFIVKRACYFNRDMIFKLRTETAKSSAISYAQSINIRH